MQSLLETLDMLALALTEHNHVWSEKEKLEYELAVGFVKVNDPYSSLQMGYLGKTEDEERAAKQAEASATATNSQSVAALKKIIAGWVCHWGLIAEIDDEHVNNLIQRLNAEAALHT